MPLSWLNSARVLAEQRFLRGNFELFENLANQILSVNATNCPRLRPGIYITMAIIIGQYSSSQYCPRLGYSSKLVSDTDLKNIAGILWYSLSPDFVRI